MIGTLSEFESNLVRLMIVTFRFQAIHHEYPNQMKKTSDAMLVRALFRDVTVEQLVNFIKIRNDLRKNPEFKKVDDTAKVLIQPILDKETPLKKMRNNYVSHIQEDGRKFKEMMGDIVLKYNLPTNWAYWSYLAGLAFMYFGLVDANFKKESDKAEKKYHAKAGFPITISSGFKMNDVIPKIGKILNPLQVKLDNKGFKTTYTKNQLNLLRKKYPNP